MDSFRPFPCISLEKDGGRPSAACHAFDVAADGQPVLTQQVNFPTVCCVSKGEGGLPLRQPGWRSDNMHLWNNNGRVSCAEIIYHCVVCVCVVSWCLVGQSAPLSLYCHLKMLDSCAWFCRGFPEFAFLTLSGGTCCMSLL